MADENSHPAAPALPQLIIYWLVTGLPLAWGIYKTVVNARPLF